MTMSERRLKMGQFCASEYLMALAHPLYYTVSLNFSPRLIQCIQPGSIRKINRRQTAIAHLVSTACIIATHVVIVPVSLTG